MKFYIPTGERSIPIAGNPLSWGLARYVGLNAWALLRLFKRQKGISPYLLQTRLKTKAVKTHLRTGLIRISY